MRRALTFLRSWLEETGSTRAAAIIRIGLAFILWMTWGDDFTLFRVRSLESALVALGFYGATGAMLVGFHARSSTALAALIGAYIYYKLGIYDGAETYVHHHTALLVIATSVCALTPCGASLSLDRWLAVRRSQRGGACVPSESGPLWAVRLLGLLVSVVYLGGAVSKTNLGWLSGDRLEQIFAHYYGNSGYPDSVWLGRFLVVATLSVVALEYALTIGLWFSRSRRFLVPLGFALHVGFYVLLPVETFSLTMLLLYVAFSPSVVDRWLEFAQGGRAEPPVATAREGRKSVKRRTKIAKKRKRRT